MGEDDGSITVDPKQLWRSTPGWAMGWFVRMLWLILWAAAIGFWSLSLIAAMAEAITR